MIQELDTDETKDEEVKVDTSGFLGGLEYQMSIYACFNFFVRSENRVDFFSQASEQFSHTIADPKRRTDRFVLRKYIKELRSLMVGDYLSKIMQELKDKDYNFVQVQSKIKELKVEAGRLSDEIHELETKRDKLTFQLIRKNDINREQEARDAAAFQVAGSVLTGLVGAGIEAFANSGSSDQDSCSIM